MKREHNAPVLSAVFVDYDNIYLSLKRRSEDAAKRFAKDAGVWLRAIENGQLISSTNGVIGDVRRRIVLNRCYGNPVPRRNPHDGSTDMSSFPFVRHHFLRAGFEVVDCPPLTAQLKNSSDIRMVMDMRDYLTHDTYFDEFIILSGDADFTPVLHRLRQHARKTVIFANDHTAAPYTAISDGEVREADLFALLLDSLTQPESNEIAPPPARAPIAQMPQTSAPAPAASVSPPAALVRLAEIRSMIMAEVVNSIRTAMAPVPLEALADRALRALGHEKTIGSGWGGAGTFRDLLRQALPSDIRLTSEPPYLAFDPSRHLVPTQAPAPMGQRPVEVTPQAVAVAQPEPSYAPPAARAQPVSLRREPALERGPAVPSPAQRAALAQSMEALAQSMEALVKSEPAPSQQQMHVAPAAAPVAMHGSARAPAARSGAARPSEPSSVQQSITRIYEACQAPPLAPLEYQAIFEIIAKEITEKGLSGSQTLAAVGHAARERGVDVQPDDVRFVMDVISEPDPWFEQGASANLFAGRFRNFVVQRCRSQGMTPSADELDLIDAWFTGGGASLNRGRFALEAEDQAAGAYRQSVPNARSEPQAATAPAPAPQPRNVAPAGAPDGRSASSGRWWSLDEPRQPAVAPDSMAEATDDFPRIVRTRQRV